MPLAPPIPKNLLATLKESMDLMTEEQLLGVHHAVLDKEIERLRQVISDDAEREQAEGKWDNLPEVIAEYRARNRRP
ncbi:MAG: hypothetical protein NTV80_19815 [Verrucomicrobia bacterium]|nr:hypothetical protein [Verrucomicrobiota bacterium]